MNHNLIPKLKTLKPRELPQYNLLSAVPMYFTATRDLSTLDFLVSPELYLDELTSDKLFAPPYHNPVPISK